MEKAWLKFALLIGLLVIASCFPLGAESRRVVSLRCKVAKDCKFLCPTCKFCFCFDHLCACSNKELTAQAIIGQQGD
ncbi:unnamed protein product, partial [Vitis vinifera]|uniref:Uncharacterized protein n=1 Tax=Vitis vinifera TaxID=29760 RepID=D7TAD1_VITVI